MIARPFKELDFDEASKIISSHSTMYGIPLEHSRYVDALLDNSGLAISILDDNNKLFGVARQYWWPGQPTWSVGSLFFREKYNSLAVINAGKSLFNFMTERAEQDDRYDFYYIVRDSGSIRKNMSLRENPELAERYSIVESEIIPPYTLPKFKSFEAMLGNMAGKNTKTLVVRHGYLKPEFRKNLWEKM